MTTKYKTQGFVFKKEDRLEADRMFSVFTKNHGRVEVFAKAIRKIDAKLRSGIEIFSLCDIEFIYGKNRKTLTDAVFLKKYYGIIKSPEKLEVAFLVVTHFDKFIKGEQKEKEILELLIQTFDRLDNYPNSKDYHLIYYYFIWNIVSLLGYKPELFSCVVCRKLLNPMVLYFSNQEGGLVCQGCVSAKKDAVRITSDVVKVLRLIIKEDWQMLLKLKMGIHCNKLLQEISEQYSNYLIHSYHAKIT